MDTIKIYICYLHLSRHCNNPEGRERDPASQTGRRLHQDTCQWEGRSWSSYTREGTRGSAHSVAKHRPVWLRISRLDTKYHHSSFSQMSHPVVLWQAAAHARSVSSSAHQSGHAPPGPHTGAQYCARHSGEKFKF